MSVPPITGAIPDNLADLVGNTPLVRLTRVAPDCGAELLAKLEVYNPAGSVKDRIGVSMIDAAAMCATTAARELEFTVR